MPALPSYTPARKRVVSATAAVAALVLAFTGLSATVTAAPAAHAAQGDPFDCTVPTFFAQAEEPVGKLQLYTGSYTSDGKSLWDPLGTSQKDPNVYNAVAFNPKDKYLYGTVTDDPNDRTVTAVNGSFVRIDNAGGVTNIGVSTTPLGTAANTLWDSGEFDSDGNYYVASGNAGTKKLYKISGLTDVESATGGPRPTLTEITLGSSIRFADLAFKDGYLWAPNYNESATIYRINVNPALGTVGAVNTYTGLASVMDASGYGSAFTMTNGNLAFVGTNNKMVQIAVKNPTSSNPTFSQVSSVTAPTNQRSNATNCSSALPAKLQITKEGPATVVLGQPITWTVTVKNLGEGISSGFVLTDTLPSGLEDVRVTSDDSSCVLIPENAPDMAVCNGGLLRVGETATVTVTATAPSTPGPITNNATVVGNEDPNPQSAEPVVTDVVRATQTGVPVTVEPQHAVTVLPTTSTDGGELTLVDGNVRFTPRDGYSGIDSFSYTDETGDVNVIVYVMPTAAPDADEIPVGGTSTIPVADLVALGVGTDLELDSVDDPSNGATVEIVDGDVVFTPPAATAGKMTFTYTLVGQDGLGVTDTVIVTVLNQVTASADTGSVVAGSFTDIAVRSNDTNAATENRSLQAPTIVTDKAPQHGSAAPQSNGTIRYEPEQGFSGTDTFSYRVCDDSTPAVCAEAEVTVTVANVFMPTGDGAADTGVTTPQNTAKNLPIASIVTPLGREIDPTRVALGSASHGTVTVDPVNGTITYTPNPGYSGPDSFTVGVCDTAGECTDDDNALVVAVTVDENAVAAVDDTATVDAASADHPSRVDIDVRGNDTTASGQALAVPTEVSTPAHGTARVQADGTIRYTPNDGFSGEDTFSYEVCDTSTPSAVCSGPATVTVTVQNVFTQGGAAVTPATTPHNTKVVITPGSLVTPRGEALDPVRVAVVPGHGPENGSVVVDAVTHLITYTPDHGYTGGDEFTIELCDTSSPVQCTEVVVAVTVGANVVTAASVTTTTDYATPIEIPVLPDAMSQSGQELRDPEITGQPGNGEATVGTDGLITYAPEAGFSGEDSFSYRVCDTSDPTPVCGMAAVTVTVHNVFSDGEVLVDGVATPQNTPLEIDPDGVVTPSGAPLDPTAVTLVVGEGPGHGEVRIDPIGGTIIYTPDDGYSGDDAFDVTLCDLHGECATVTIQVRVSENEVAATNDSRSTTVDTVVVVDVLANDTTGTGQPFAAPLVTLGPANGTATVVGASIRYTPDTGFTGVDTFEYVACDTSYPDAVCAPARVTITVENVFVEGPAVADGVSTRRDDPVTIPLDDIVTTRGAPLDLGALDVTTGPEHGTVDIDVATGDVVYTPEGGYTGSDAFELRVCDLSEPQQCTTVVVGIAIAAPALPFTGAQSVGLAAGASLSVALGGVLLLFVARRRTIRHRA